ncbi:MAG: transcriptional regulator [Spirochaetales bacterium]|nr:transcriptional regulator [Spirochaetales bacterium]
MKYKLKTQYYRWLNIHDTLKQKHYPSAGSIAQSLEVSVKTIRRDIEYLRDMLNAPIEYDPHRKGFFYTSDDFEPGKMRLTGKEYLAMLLFSKVFSQYRNTPWYENLAALYSRMKDFLADEVEIDPDLLDTTVLIYGSPITNISASTWEEVMKALRAKNTLHFKYRKPGKNEDEAISLHVYRVVGYRGDWYCVGYCPARKVIRIYSMARMKKFSQSDSYRIPKRFRLEDHIQGSFGMFLEDHDYKVHIEFDRTIAPFIKERVWGRGQKLVPLKNNGVKLIFSASSLVELSAWVLSWGGHAKVTSPKELIARVAEEIKKLGKMYR